MVPSGAPTEETVQALAALLQPGDTILDGGNTRFHDDTRRAAELKNKGHSLCRCRNQRRDMGIDRGLLPHGRGRAGDSSTIDPHLQNVGA